MRDPNDQPNECIVPPGVTGSLQAAAIESVAEVVISDFVDLDEILQKPGKKR